MFMMTVSISVADPQILKRRSVDLGTTLSQWLKTPKGSSHARAHQEHRVMRQR
jgi:hypothetical protein